MDRTRYGRRVSSSKTTAEDAGDRMPARLPPTLAEHVGYLSVRLGQRAQRLFEVAIAELGLRPSLFDFLAALDHAGPSSQRELAALLGIDATRIVAVADELERSGVVARSVDPLDRRRNLITMSSDGRALFQRARAIAVEVETELLAPLTATEGAALRKLLRRSLAMEHTGRSPKT